MRQYIVAKNVLDVIFYYHIGHGEREKNNISREEMSSADNYKKKSIICTLFQLLSIFSYYAISNRLEFIRNS